MKVENTGENPEQELAPVDNTEVTETIKEAPKVEKVVAPKKVSSKSKEDKIVDVNTILAQMQSEMNELKAKNDNLETLVRKTGDTNKMADFDRSKEKLKNFSFSIKYYPNLMDEERYPVISWRTVKNHVANEAKIVDQEIEIVYIKNGKKVKEVIKLVEFVRTLEKSEKILATKMENLDGSKVHVSKAINPESQLQYYLMHPEEDTFKVTLNIDGKEIEFLSTYLNA